MTVKTWQTSVRQLGQAVALADIADPAGLALVATLATTSSDIRVGRAAPRKRGQMSSRPWSRRGGSRVRGTPLCRIPRMRRSGRDVVS